MKYFVALVSKLTYTKDGKVRAVAQKTVVIPSQGATSCFSSKDHRYGPRRRFRLVLR